MAQKAGMLLGVLLCLDLGTGVWASELSLSVVLSPGFPESALGGVVEAFSGLRGLRPHFIRFPDHDAGMEAGLAATTDNALFVTRAEVCVELLANASVGAAVLTTGGEEAFLSAFAYALAFYHLPVFIAHERDARFADKTVYPSVVRVGGGWETEAVLWAALARELAFKQLLFLHTTEPNGEAAAAAFRDLIAQQNVINVTLPPSILPQPSPHLSSTLQVQRVIPLEAGLTSARSELAEADEAETSNVFILHARLTISFAPLS